jgi:hypothetical protein
MNRTPRVAVVGSTGAVGLEMIKTLEKRQFPLGLVFAQGGPHHLDLELDAVPPPFSDRRGSFPDRGFPSLTTGHDFGEHFTVQVWPEMVKRVGLKDRIDNPTGSVKDSSGHQSSSISS